MRILSTLLVALLFGHATAFWQQGHLMGKSTFVFLIAFSVARIAFDKLQSENPSALNAANDLLKVYSQAQPSMTHLEGEYPFVECATFADEIKAKGGSWQSGWHFIDTPFLDEGGSISDFPGF